MIKKAKELCPCCNATLRQNSRGHLFCGICNWSQDQKGEVTHEDN